MLQLLVVTCVVTSEVKQRAWSTTHQMALRDRTVSYLAKRSRKEGTASTSHNNPYTLCDRPYFYLQCTFILLGHLTQSQQDTNIYVSHFKMHCCHTQNKDMSQMQLNMGLIRLFCIHKSVCTVDKWKYAWWATHVLHIVFFRQTCRVQFTMKRRYINHCSNVGLINVIIGSRPIHYYCLCASKMQQSNGWNFSH